jgi:putative restriction endonuclease
VSTPADLPKKADHAIPKIGALRSSAVRAGFSPEVQEALTADPALIAQIAARILEQHFPESLHQDILNAVGLQLETGPVTNSPFCTPRINL